MKKTTVNMGSLTRMIRGAIVTVLENKYNIRDGKDVKAIENLAKFAISEYVGNITRVEMEKSTITETVRAKIREAAESLAVVETQKYLLSEEMTKHMEQARIHIRKNINTYFKRAIDAEIRNRVMDIANEKAIELVKQILGDELRVNLHVYKSPASTNKLENLVFSIECESPSITEKETDDDDDHDGDH